MRFKLVFFIAVYLFVCNFNTDFTFAEVKHDNGLLDTEYIIKYKDGVDFSDVSIPSNINKEKIHSNMECLKAYDETSSYYIENYLANDPRVEYIQQNRELQIMSVVNDVYYNRQWGLENSGQVYFKPGIKGMDINFKKFIESIVVDDNKEITVALVDTAVDITHEDLKESIFVNEKEIAGNGIDDDKNGFKDDVNGWDFLNKDNTIWDSVSGDKHGTHLAGIIGAGLNEKGVCGVFPKVKILPIKIMDNLTDGDTVSAIKAIEYAKKMNVKIMNCSWGSEFYDQALFDCMKESGMLFICAAGNSHANSKEKPIYPACFRLDNIISVASIGNCGVRSEFSNYGKNITLTAPGEYVLSTLPNNKYGYLSGTSMAAAFVTGVAAAVYSRYSDENVISIKQRIKNGVFQLKSLENSVSTSGIVDIYSSVFSDYSRQFQDEISISENDQQYLLQWNRDLDALSYELEVDRDKIYSVSQNVYEVGKYENENNHIFRIRSVYSSNGLLEKSRWSNAKMVGYKQVQQPKETEQTSLTPTHTSIHTPKPTAISTQPEKNSQNRKPSSGSSTKNENDSSGDIPKQNIKATQTPAITPTITQTMTPNLSVDKYLVNESKREIPAEIYKEVEKHWARQAILEMLQRGIITGYENKTIKPDNRITRAELAVLLMKAKGIVPKEDSLGFEDEAKVPEWATGYIKEAVRLKIITGYQDNTIRANQEITRAEAVVMLIKAFKEDHSEDKLKGFKDYDNIPGWARGYLSTAYANNILVGYQDNTIRAGNTITRAEIITMLLKCLNV